MESVKDKVVLLTGASGAIGSETAKLFSKYGSKLALVGRNVEKLQTVSEDCIKMGVSADDVLMINADVTVSEDVQRIVDETISKFSKIDILINNAGILRRSPIEQTSMEEIREIFDVNLFGVISLTKLVIPHLKKTKGCIVNNSSCSGIRAWVTGAAYSLAKASLDMLTSILAIDLGESGVRVNSVNALFVKSPMPASFFGVPDENKEELFDSLGAASPLGRIAEVVDVANAILFLASDSAAFISGTILPIDGGASKTTSWFQGDRELMKKICQ